MGARKKTGGAPAKTRTSIWLANDLRAQLDRRCEADNRSLAQVIDLLLRAGLAKQPQPKKVTADASIFG